MRKYIATFIASIIFAQIGHAETDAELEKYLAQAKPPKEIIPSVIEQYANSIGCEFNINRENIVEYEIEGKKSFVALFSLDSGCSGGTASSRPVFVVLQPGAYDRYFVNPKYSSPVQTSNKFPRVVQSIFLKDGQLLYKALELDPQKDALCCPSKPIAGKVVYENGEWNAIQAK